MFIQPYQPHELHFAYCYRVYFRWRTWRNRSCQTLGQLNSENLNELLNAYGIRVLECATSETDLIAIVSLQPSETISACASKLKGRVSKWLHAKLQLEEPMHLLSQGYFARTVGKSTREAVEKYLENQGDHHGYGKRVLPPIFVQRYELNAEDEARLAPKHADVVALFHIVLATWQRRGVFGAEEGRKIAAEWRRRQAKSRIAIIKISFVPDHVHLALRMHPTVSPADVVVTLINAAQDTVQDALVRAGVDRLWNKSAYVGSCGDLTSAQLRIYVENLRED